MGRFLADLPEHPVPEAIRMDMLLGHEVVRDPLHGDIRITALERSIIDTEAFQRLRGIKQLGPTNLVYPGATHDRFTHSIGTLHVAQQLIDTVNGNATRHDNEYMIELGAYPTLLTRLVALVHDVAHIPFGHTLEDEGNLFTVKRDGEVVRLAEWDDPRRLDLWLGRSREIPAVISHFLSEYDASADLIDRLLKDIPLYLTTKRKSLMDLDFPFVQDLVGNTLCADLLDYTHRDALFCGLSERIGHRFTQYAAVVRCEREQTDEAEPEHFRASTARGARGRVVLLAYRIELGHRRNEEHRLVKKNGVLSEAMGLLRHRFSLAEKVYFHRTKIKFSSMIVSAVGEALDQGFLSLEDLYRLSDEALLDLLESGKYDHSGDRITHTPPPARTLQLTQAIRNRRAYREVFKVGFKPEGEDLATEKLTAAREKCRDPETRLGIERELESDLMLAEGSISVYCPEQEMNFKRFQMLVQLGPGNPIKTYESLLEPENIKEIDSLAARYHKMWAIRVFVDQRALDLDPERLPSRLRGLCADEYYLGLASDGDEPLAGSRMYILATMEADRLLSEEGVTIPYHILDEVALAEYRGQKSAEARTTVRDYLRRSLEQDS